jgi:hypothetical protein
MWEAIEIEDWKTVPHISGRVATEQDVKDGRAVFYVPSGSEPYETELPLFALQTEENSKKKIPCIAIQIENTPEGTAVGVRYIDGGNGVGMANEFEFYSEVPADLSL